MVHPVVAYEDPSPSANDRHPLVILSVSREMILKILHCVGSLRISSARGRAVPTSRSKNNTGEVAEFSALAEAVTIHVACLALSKSTPSNSRP